MRVKGSSKSHDALIRSITSLLIHKCKHSGWTKVNRQQITTEHNFVNVSLKIVHSQHIEMNDRLTFSQTWDEWSRRMLPKLGREFLQWCRQFQGKDSSHLSMMLCLKSLSSRHQMKSQENLCALFSSQRSNLKRNCMIKGKPSAKNNKCKVF